MKRLLTSELVKWKAQSRRNPILLDGARQVGKSYLIETCFGKKHFSQVLKLDFLASPHLADIFSEGLDPDHLLKGIQLALGVRFNPATDLLFFDEIGECQNAVTALKFFAEKRPDLYICASGSNIGLLRSFPVGKVHFIELHAMCFEEFLMAIGDELLLGAYRDMAREKIAHQKLWARLLEFYFTGGMPAAVSAWFAMDDIDIIGRCDAVTSIHRDIFEGYLRDFGKYAGKVNAQHIESVFKDVPRQLAVNIDDSVKRFRFSGVIEGKNRYEQLRGPIDWLEKTKLISKCYPINCEPKVPLMAYSKKNKFKIFYGDIGLLGYALGLTYSDHLRQNYDYKGYLAENFVQTEWCTRMHAPIYSWEEKNSEIEFLYKDKQGEIIPVEVKSGRRTQAKSLKTYKVRYSPARTLKLIGAAGGTKSEQDMVWPIYYASHVCAL